jgi:mycofactocin precursor
VIEPELSEVTDLNSMDSPQAETPQVLQEIVIEELGIDGICGVY